jgi:DNA-directed RNA polymerase subunit RPC12/RpoP
VLLRHITRYHPFFYRGPIRCVYCNFGCSSNDEWVKHQKEMHKYICKTCQQSFTSRSGIYIYNLIKKARSNSYLYYTRSIGIYICLLIVHSSSHLLFSRTFIVYSQIKGSNMSEKINIHN